MSLRALFSFVLLLHSVCVPFVFGVEPYGAVFNDVQVEYPDTPSVIHITKKPYFAKGDGITDDTLAIQQALSDMMGQHKMLYFRPGQVHSTHGSLAYAS